MRTRNLSCPYCNKRTTREKMINHLEYNHSDQLPEGFTPLRMTFHLANKKPIEYRRACRVCGNPTEWDEKKGRYNFLCSNPLCKEKHIAKMKSDMGEKYGAYRPTATPEGLEKMLAARRISGKYKWSDGTVFNYTGTYELETLKFMDKVLEIKSEDIMVPGPVLEYDYKGQKHFYITDIYYRPYNLVIEVKDGGKSVNKNKEYAETRAKQMAKEKHVIQNTDYNYIRLTDKDMSQLMAVLGDLKYHMVEKDTDRVIHVNENTPMAGIAPVVGFNPDKDVVMVNYMKKKTFVDDSDYAIADSPKFDTVYTRDQDGILRKLDKKVLLGSYYTPYIVRGRRESIVESLYNNKDKFVDKNFIYETVFGHPMFSKDQIKYESAETYEDYYQGLENIKDFFKEEDMVESRFLESSDGQFNLDDWNPIDNNILYITGMAGSGKSTTTKDLVESYHCNSVCLDDVSYFYMAQGKVNGKLYYNNLKESCPGSEEFFDLNPRTKIGDLQTHRDTIPVLKEFCSWFENKFRNNGELYILDSFYLPYLHEASFYVDKPTIVKENTFDTIVMRRVTRFKPNNVISEKDIEIEHKNKRLQDNYQEYVDFSNKLSSFISESASLLEESSKDSDISKPWFVKSKDGVDNAVVKHKDYPKLMRGRSSMLILKQVQGKLYVYLRKNKGEDLKHDGKYSAPGGGWNKSERPKDAAIREAREEARINVDRVRYCGTLIEYHETVHDWVRDNVENPKDWWYGYYSKIYVGFYSGKYNGPIAKRDEETSFIKDGKFYSYDDVVYDLPSEYAEAIDMYIQGDSLQESVTEKDIQKNHKLQPIFIVNTFTGTWDGKLIKAAAGIKYSHALISLNSKLSPMYSFDEAWVTDVKDPSKKTKYKGLIVDNFERYKRDMGFGDLRVVVILVTNETKKKIEQAIKYYTDRIDMTKYSYKKLIGGLVGSKEMNSFGDMAMVCSEFVDSILKFANIDISGKASSNTKPDDLASFKDRNNYFQLYEGKISNYDNRKIDKMIENLMNNTEYKNLKSQTKNSMKNPYEHELGRENLIPGIVARAGKVSIGKFKKKVVKEDGSFEFVNEEITE